MDKKNNNKQHNFFALINRQKLIDRWSLMHNRYNESVSLHGYNAATIAHALGLIDNEIFDIKQTDANLAASIALYHDATEVLTGDMPTPVKYRNSAMLEAYAEAEGDALNQLLAQLPEKLKPAYQKILAPDINSREAQLAKFADKISAYIKCIEEVDSGNNDFKAAKKSTAKILDKIEDKTVKYYIDNFVASFSLSLDELLK